MMAHCDVKFNDTMYQQGPRPDFDKSEWLNEKDTLDLDLPNLPYLIDKEVTLTESSAIMRYLARVYNP